MDSRTSLIAAALALALGFATAPPAQACGEVMYRMGSALRYQAHATRHPAQILVYGESGAASAQGMDREAFRRSLEAAGHRITLVESPEALAEALAARGYDIVITAADAVPAVAAALDRADHEPALIPVMGRRAGDALRRQYPEALVVDVGANRMLKRIERTMEARGS